MSKYTAINFKTLAIWVWGIHLKKMEAFANKGASLYMSIPDSLFIVTTT